MEGIEGTREILAQITACASTPAGEMLTLAPRAYVDAGVYEAERSAIFERAWFCVGRSDSFAGPGDYVALTIAAEPVLVLRDSDGVLRALSNVCRHRLYPLVPEGRGSASKLTCAYHLWTYRLDGSLAGAPDMNAVPGFDRASCALPSFRVEEWLGFVFVSLDRNAGPLRPKIAGVEGIFANHDIPDGVSVAGYRKEWTGNWKLAVENASESYHHMGLHGQSLEPYMPARGSQVCSIGEDWAWHRTPILADVAAAYGVRLDYPTRLAPDDRAAMKVVTIFPSFLLLSIGDLVNWISWIPLAVARTEVRAGLLLPPAALAVEEDHEQLRAGMQAGLEMVNGEDELATGLVQKAAASRLAARCLLSPKEGVLGGFYRYLARQLAEGTIGAG